MAFLQAVHFALVDYLNTTMISIAQQEDGIEVGNDIPRLIEALKDGGIRC